MLSHIQGVTVGQDVHGSTVQIFPEQYVLVRNVQGQGALHELHLMFCM